MEEHKIHPLAAEELLAPTLKPKVDLYEDYIYLILHFPALKHTHGTDKNQEVDFIIGKNFLITGRYDTVDALHKFSRVFEVNSVLDKSDMGDHAGFIFFYMIRKLYKSIEHELEYLADEREQVEEKIFEGQEKAMVYEISRLTRSVLDLKQALSAHGEILSSFETAGRRFFGDTFSYHLHSIVGEYYRIHTYIENELDDLRELRQTNDSLLTTKQNEVMKILTIMAFVTFPLSVVASVFGMNTSHLPLVGSPNDFWIVIGIMLGLTLLFFGYFKYKKWL